MKINNLLENITPTSNPDQGQGGQAPKFGRSDKVLEDDKVEESSVGTSVAGGIAPNATAVGGMQRRGKGSMLQGIKTSAKFPNSQAVKEEQLDEIFNPSSSIAHFLRAASSLAADYIPVAIGAAGTFVATNAMLGPVAAMMASSTVGTQILQSLQGQQNKVPGLVQKLVEKYFGSEQEEVEFALLHAKAAFLGQPEFRWRGEQWPVTLDKKSAEAIVEKNDKYWLEQQVNQQSQQPAMAETRKASTQTARAEFGKRPRAELSDKEKEKKKAESDRLWDMLQAHIANAEKSEKLDEVDPRNFDSDEDYYAARNAPVKQRSAPSFRPRDTDSYGNSWSEEEAFRANQRRYAAAKKKAEQEADHDRLATGTNEEQVNEKSKSQAQFRTMAAVAHNPKFAKKVGISQKVGKEFHSADRKQNYKDLPKEVDEAGGNVPSGMTWQGGKLQKRPELVAAAKGNRNYQAYLKRKAAKEKEQSVAEGDVVQFPKKHKGDISNMHSCPKCGGDTHGGKYEGHEVQVCIPCKQVYLPPNSGIDQQGNKIKEQDVAEAGEWTKLPNGNWRNMHTGAQQSTPPKTKKPRRTMGLNASLEQHADDKMKELGHKFKPVAEEFNPEYDDESGMAESNLHTIARAAQGLIDTIGEDENLPEWCQEKIAKVEGMLVAVWDYLQSQEEQGIDPQVDEDWNKVNHHDKTDGMSPKAVKAYRRENPGSKLKTAVTTKPSKLKPGSKAAKRRKSFCARMSGNKGPMKDEKGRPTPKAKALSRWNCESVEQTVQMLESVHRDLSEVKQRLDPKCWKGYKKQGTKMKGGTRVNNCVKVDEAEFTEDKLAQDLYRDLQIFKKGTDKDIGSKAKDKEIGNKPADKDIVAKEGFDDFVKGAKRVVKGKTDPTMASAHRSNEYIKSLGTGDKETIRKAERNLDRVNKVTHGKMSEAGVEEGIGGDMAKLGGIAALGVGGALVGNYSDTQQPKVEIGGQIAFVEPSYSNVPDSAMTLTGKDGKTYRVWATKGTAQSSKRYHAVPVKQVKEQGVDEGIGDTIKKKAKQFSRYMTEPNSPHNDQVRSRAKNIDKIRKQEEKKSVFEKDPEAMREFERSGGYKAGIDVMGWQVGWIAAKHEHGDTMKEAFQKLYYGGGSSFPFSERAFKLAWVAYNKHYGPQGNLEEMDGDGAGRDGSNRKSHSTYGSRDKHNIPDGPDIHLGSDSAMTSKDIQDKALDTLTKMLSQPENMNVLKRLKNK